MHIHTHTKIQVFRAQQIAKWKGPRPDETKANTIFCSILLTLLML